MNESGLLELTTDNFEQFLKDNSEIPVLLDFNADWCGPCQAQKPALEALEATEADGRYKIASINIDNEPALAEQFEISSIPCLILIKNGKEQSRKIGLQSEGALKRMLGVK